MTWRTVTVFFVLLTAGVPVQGQTCQEQCRENCGTTGLTRDGSGERIVNIAYGKPANVSSVLTGRQGTSGPGCMAVNGRTSTAYRTPTERPLGNANCVHTNLGDYAASWFVDLGRQYTIDNITIFRINGSALSRRMAGLSVLVGNETTNQTCFSFPNSTDTPALDALPEQMDITCDPPLTGHTVWLQKHGQDRDQAYYVINVCEVQVWVCKIKLYGPSCDMNCTDLCGGDGSCDRMSGVCVQGCVPGYSFNTLTSVCEKCPDGSYGDSCSTTCGNCKGGVVCDKVNGSCPSGCQPGFDPAYPNCATPCSGKTYGEQCSAQCGLCKDGEVCDTVTGHCSACTPNLLAPLCQVCDAGWHGWSCDKECSALCGEDRSCGRNSGMCVQGCVIGYVLSGSSCEKCRAGQYGDDCGQTCGQCSGSACRHDNGTCEAGCVDGYEGPLCAVKVQVPGSGPGVGAVVGAAVAGIVVGVVIVVVLFIVIRRTRLMSDSGARNTKSAPSKSNDIPNTAPAERHRADEGSHYEVTEEEECRYVNVNVKEENFYNPLQTPDEEGAAYSQFQAPKKGEVLYQNQPQTPRKGNAIEACYSNT